MQLCLHRMKQPTKHPALLLPVVAPVGACATTDGTSAPAHDDPVARSGAQIATAATTPLVDLNLVNAPLPPAHPRPPGISLVEVRELRVDQRVHFAAMIFVEGEAFINLRPREPGQPRRRVGKIAS